MSLASAITVESPGSTSRSKRDGADESEQATHVTGSQRSRPHALSVAVLAISLALVAVLTWASWSEHNSTEQRLLDVRAREAGAVISASVPTVQTPLASAAELAEATNGDPNQFRLFMGSYVSAGVPFVSASLWPTQTAPAQPAVVVGTAPDLSESPVQAHALVNQVAQSHVLGVVGLLDRPQPRLGYAFSAPGSQRFVVYAESAVPANRRLRIESNSAFSDLSYALYLGRTPRRADLVATSLDHPPDTGRYSVTTVPFGDNAFTLVAMARDNLGGSLSADLPWLIGLFGSILAVLAALATERLIRRRRRAETAATEMGVLAEENRRLYSEQRSLAEALQHALLPVDLPDFAGVDIHVMYLPGVGGVEIGGDWYDVIHLDENRFLLVIGDVSGRGLRAATIMASLRYATRAYAAEGDPPGKILEKLSNLSSVADDGHFATVLCALVDVGRHEVTLANAGHLNPLLLVGDEGHFVRTDVGMPVGVRRHVEYAPVTVPLPERATLLAFTDGLIERRGEDLDVSMERLRTVALGSRGPLDQVLDQLVRRLTPDGSDDDIAVVGVRWQR